MVRKTRVATQWGLVSCYTGTVICHIFVDNQGFSGHCSATGTDWVPLRMTYDSTSKRCRTRDQYKLAHGTVGDTRERGYIRSKCLSKMHKIGVADSAARRSVPQPSAVQAEA